MDPATIVIVDTHAGFLRALRTAMSADPRLSVVAEATDLRAARAAVLRHRADALVVDAGVVEAAGGRLGPLPAGTTVIVVGMDDAPGLAERARRQGATDYVVKDDARLLVDAVLAGLEGSEVSERSRAAAQDRSPTRPARRREQASPPPAGSGP